MRIFLIICILMGILIPVCVIYVDQHKPIPTIEVSILSISIADPTPTPMATATPILPLQNRSQVEQFMLADTTNNNPYTDTYKCGNFADDVVANAIANGIEANVIIVLWEGSYTPHAIVLFPTEEGDIYVDATSGDWWVNFKLGEGEYNSYSMTDATQFGFKDKTVAMYGIRKTDYTEWVYVRPTPTPTSTQSPVPTPTLTIIPTPTPNADGSPYFCSPCEGGMFLINVRWWNMWQCYNTHPLKNKEQVKEFMIWDNGEQIPYSATHTCWNFAVGLIANAESNSIEAHLLIITWFGGDFQHAIVAFPTYEDGMVYVDPTSGDCFVNFTKEVGEYETYGVIDSNVHGFYNMTLASYYMYSQNGQIDYWYAQ